ncbi:MAG: inositol monophosphatase family protein [Shimia sp.]
MPVDPALRTHLIAALRETARTEIRPRFRALRPDQIETKSGPQDLVTEADLAVEARLRDEIARLMPGVPLVGEEGVSADPSELRHVTGAEAVVLDPIDGTWNFAHGLAEFGTILAVLEGGETVFSVLYDPIVDDWIWAAKGEGAWYGTQRLRLPEAGPLDTLTGMLGPFRLDAAQWARIAALYPRFGKVADLRCSLWDYRLLTQGRAAFKLNAMLNVWDHAGGVLALTEAGGHAALLDGTPYVPAMTEGRLLACGSEALWDALAPLLTEALEG